MRLLEYVKYKLARVSITIRIVQNKSYTRTMYNV